MTDWLVVVPLIEKPELTQEARRAHENDARVLYVDNTKKKHYRRIYAGRYGLVVNGSGQNWGVSKAWNVGLRRGHDWTLIMSSSVVLPHGLAHALAQFDEVIDAGEEWAVFTEEAFHAFAVSRKLIQRIGEFDEENFPTYFGDNDFLYRMKLAGLNERPKIDLGANSLRPESVARALKSGLVKVDFGELEARYVKKHGGKPGEETLVHAG